MFMFQTYALLNNPEVNRKALAKPIQRAVDQHSDREITHFAPDLTSVPRALASNGAIVAMPPVERLSCRGMGEVLDRIDESRYRGPAPVPEGHPDREIFDYEHRLAAAYYRACINTGHVLDDPAAAFGRGFGTP
jgi:hypothetical protein